MGVDLTTVPWNRLSKLAPPGTKLDDLQAAADRWGLNADVYNAAADLWEEAAMCIDISASDVPETPPVQSISQDGISVTYAVGVINYSQSERIAQHGQMTSMVRRLRAKGKPVSPLVHRDDYNPWRNNGVDEDDCDRIIIVDEV